MSKGRGAEDRVRHAQTVLEAYAPLSGGDRFEQLTDILTDLWLYSRAGGLAFQEAVTIAESHGLMEWQTDRPLFRQLKAQFAQEVKQHEGNN